MTSSTVSGRKASSGGLEAGRRKLDGFDAEGGKLVRDREALLTFYDYPAEHRKHIRTSNPIESTVATVRSAPKVASVARPGWQWPSS